MLYIMDNLEDQLNLWGYTKHPEKENDTAFFDYKEKANPHSQDLYYGFEKLNEEMWQFMEENREKASNLSYRINKGKEGISMFKEKQIHKFIPCSDKSTIKEGR